MVRRPKQTFLQRRHTDGQQIHEKCLTLLIIREMKTKTTVRYHLTLARMATSKSLQTINAGESVEKREPYYTAGGNVNWRNHCGKQYGHSSKN